MEIEQGYAAIDDGRLYYERAGSGACIVLIHGFALDRRAWDAQFAELAQRYCVLRYDLRGFGRSTLPGAKNYSHSDDLHALLVHLRIEQATLVGLSMGGWIATHFALEYPALTRALVLVDAALIGYDWSPEWKQRWGEVKTVAAQSGIAAAKQRWLQHPLFTMARTQTAVSDHLAQIVDDYSGWHWLNSDPHAALDPPDIERLHLLAAPTLVVLGERDIADFQLCADIFKNAIANAQWAPIPNVGHLANIEAPREFNRALLEFLAACASDRP